MATRTRYFFETALGSMDLAASAPYDKDDQYKDKFLRNLGIAEAKETLSEDADALLERYVANVHVNCFWYNTRVRREKLLQALFFALSVAILIGVPWFIFIAPSKFDGGGNDVIAKLTTLLAGSFAAHRAIAGWLQQRKLIGPYWKARSDLLNEIYTLETEWQNRPSTDKLENSGAKPSNRRAFATEFKDKIEASIKRAREIVQTERTQFFEKYTFPDVDLSSSLSTAATGVTGLLEKFESPSAKKAREKAKAREKLEVEVTDLDAEIAGLEALVGELDAELSSKKAERDAIDPKNQPDEHARLAAEVKTLISEIAGKRTERKLNVQIRAQKIARL